jgi:hypothetical protein
MIRCLAPLFVIALTPLSAFADKLTSSEILAHLSGDWEVRDDRWGPSEPSFCRDGFVRIRIGENGTLYRLQWIAGDTGLPEERSEQTFRIEPGGYSATGDRIADPYAVRGIGSEPVMDSGGKPFPPLLMVNQMPDADTVEKALWFQWTDPVFGAHGALATLTRCPAGAPKADQ